MQADRLSGATRALEDFLVAKFAQTMRAWSADLVSDIYAISLYRDDNGVPYRPDLCLVYNTRSSLALPRRATPTEAKWNLAYWAPQAEWMCIESKRGPNGSWIEDAEGSQALDTWIRAVMMGCPTDDVYDVIVPEFAALACRVGRRLHDSGQIRAIFGWDVPVIMHDDEWDEAVMLNTAAANPAGVADEFLNTQVF